MFIIDPGTLKKVKIRSKQGLSLLKSYVKYFQNGGSYTSLAISIEPEQTDMSKITAGLPGVAPNRRQEPPASTFSDQIIKVDSPENIEQEEKDIKQIKDKYLKDIEKNEFIVRKSRLSGTIMFWAPEVYNDKMKSLDSYSLNTDIWSLGLVFFKLLTGYDFYILLDIINKNNDDPKKVLKLIKTQNTPLSNQMYVTNLINNESIVQKSMKYFDLFSNEYKEYLSEENFNKLKDVFDIIKNMIKIEPEDRININDIVTKLTNIIKINTEKVTIPFDELESNKIKKKIVNPNFFTKVENYFETATEKISVYKFGNNNEQNKMFDLKDKTREKCTSKNSCIIAKSDENINEVLLHRYLSEKDNENKYIVDFYKYDNYQDGFFIYMEHTPQSLLDYWRMNLNIRDLIRDLSKYYVKSSRIENSRKHNKIGTQKEVEQQQQQQREIYESYKDASGVELGEEGCNSQGNPCKLQGDKSGQNITCRTYGLKQKCKTSNKEFAKKVQQEINYNIFEEIFIIILKTAEALQFFHQHNILHGDIKLGNIVIQKQEIGNENKYSVKFIDVGESNILLNGQIYKLELHKEEAKEIGSDFLSKMGLDSSLFKTDPEEEKEAEYASLYDTPHSSNEYKVSI